MPRARSAGPVGLLVGVGFGLDVDLVLVKVEIVISHCQLFVIEDVKLANWNRALRHKSSFPIRPNCQLHLANAGTLVTTNHTVWFNLPRRLDGPREGGREAEEEAFSLIA